MNIDILPAREFRFALPREEPLTVTMIQVHSEDGFEGISRS